MHCSRQIKDKIGYPSVNNTEKAGKVGRWLVVVNSFFCEIPDE
ncbi:hypothetical protein ADIS_3403 [Lunatimonas lonarensis]|uniref:Uncharacterized protein n=1 Tax=Lunatimonas lonarensis TaxID=1232681 RepID=R7ZQ84_9BACT|nr:hypothetical protein ADIS_3403 [Lunatimonas lonarensis]